MGFKDRMNALGRDFQDVPASYITLFVGTLALMFGFWIAYFGPRSSWVNILFMYFLIMGAAITLTAVGAIISATWKGRKPD